MQKKLNLLDLFCLASGAMISSGLFILPGVAYEIAGPAVVLAYIMAGILAVTGVLSQAELVSAMPKAGGTYFYVMRSMGPAAGTVQGVMIWLSLSLKTAFALVGMASFTSLVLPDGWSLNNTSIAVALTLFFAVLNTLGVKKAGYMQNVLVLSLIAILCFFVAKGISQVDVQHLTPFAPFGMSAVFTTAGMVFVSFGGLLKVASVAEDAQRPERNIAVAMLLSLFLVTLLYVLVVFVASGVLGDDLRGSLTPVSDAAGLFMGKPGTVILGIAALFAFISTANAGIMASSRYPYALACDEMMPEVLAGKNSAGMPSAALAVTTAIIIISLFLPLKMLVKMASGVLIITFMLSCLCVIIMRESRLLNYQPKFRSPFYPWIQIAGSIGCLALLVGMGWQAVAGCLLLIGVSLFFYWFYGRIRTNQEYALMHIIERLTAKDLTEHMLEDELKTIIRKRDDIVVDRFDRIIESCDILDLDDDCDAAGLFDQLVEHLSLGDDSSREEIKKLLWQREQDSSTVISDGLAIPHIIVEGQGLFDIVLVRSRAGIVFPDANSKPVYAVFCLVGTRDQRNFHLQALSAIAQVAMKSEFMKKWREAKGISGLRDIVLLSHRMREGQ
ncbi:MAG: amino acid permease [Kiritimatiellia bacterium]